MLQKFARLFKRELRTGEDARGVVVDPSDGLSGEKVRFVIWDLDDTFWRGTLTEGGLDYHQSNHDIVIELAQRGIISSICSRNDFETVKAILVERGIWNYFVFPSIDWSSKGQRLKQIVQASQLRAQTILFIDDNAMNRAEALRFVDGIRAIHPDSAAALLDNPLFDGKDDRGLTRLSHYKLLERRAEDMKESGDNSAFLKESDIRVIIDPEVEKHIDRAIELINRTNQLNFTKLRLPEDNDAARNEIFFMLNRTDIQAGLVRVLDRYGDYGYCGIYVQERSLHSSPKLLHYCFSCRTLGMEVETWLYRRLGQPALSIKGDVLTDIFDHNRAVDWISLETLGPEDKPENQSAPAIVPRIVIRGGCESVAISHYFEVLTEQMVNEFSFDRDELPIRIDHSEMLKLALENPEPEAMQSILKLGFRETDFQTKILDGVHAGRSVYVFGLWAEIDNIVFRNREHGVQIPTYLSTKYRTNPDEILSLQFEELRDRLGTIQLPEEIVELRKNYDYVGVITAEATRQNIIRSIALLPPQSLVFLIGAPESTRDSDRSLQSFPPFIDLNRTLKNCAEALNNTIYINIDDFVMHDNDRGDYRTHFSRHVYFRMFKLIRARIEEWVTADRNAG